jgi:hypothetical protein
VYSAGCNPDWDCGDEPIKTPECVWNDLDAHVREKAIRILSNFCYAYIRAKYADFALDSLNDSNSESGLFSQSKQAL